MSGSLPPQFAELEYLVAEWAIEDGHRRYLKRVASTMEEPQAFYDQVFPRGREAIDYIDQFDYGEPLPRDAANLPAGEKAELEALRAVHSAEKSRYYVNPEMSYK
jgi:hypothetical protein